MHIVYQIKWNHLNIQFISMESKFIWNKLWINSNRYNNAMREIVFKSEPKPKFEQKTKLGTIGIYLTINKYIITINEWTNWAFTDHNEHVFFVKMPS